MVKRSLIYLLSAALCALPACGDDEEIQEVIEGDGNGNGNGDDGDLTDSEVLGAVSVANRAEIRQAELAVERGNAEAVTTYAEMMIEDHTTAEQRLRALATEQGLPVEDSSVSRMLEAQSDGIEILLESLPDAEFDSAYIDAQVEVHEGLLDLIDTRLIPEASEPLIVDYLEELRDTIEEHLETALDVRDAID
ncbi:MAG: DUF4142 domain-containing protein [Pseudomonadota bacterium]|nr:MAG: hypothetical protein DIU78_15905 [Pseudomonadota bacterium]